MKRALSVSCTLLLAGTLLGLTARESGAPGTEDLLKYLRSRKNNSSVEGRTGGLTAEKKCGFWINAQLLHNWRKFTVSQQEELMSIMAPDTMQKDTIAGHFRIHYDTAGKNAPSLIDIYHNPVPGSVKAYIDSLAVIFNYVWDVEVNQLGYAPPPMDTNQTCYDIYVKDLTECGTTYLILPSLDGSNTPPRYRSYIEIDNDFIEEMNYNTFGIDGLKITAAHEFHHAIQFGYGFWIDDTYAYEITSEWIEDVVYTDINDYYNFLPLYFSEFGTGVSFNSDKYPGYERCVWAHYLSKKFGPSIMLDVWNEMRNQPYLRSLEEVLKERGSDLRSAFAEFTYWNYFTADRADPEKYYPEGEKYPRFSPCRQTLFTGGTSMVNAAVYGMSSSIYEFCSPPDTFSVIMANVDIESAVSRSEIPQRFDITISNGPVSTPYTELKNGSKVKISFQNDPANWRYFFSKELVNISVAPNPFFPERSQRLLLGVGSDNSGTAEVFFYSSSLSLVHSGYFQILNTSGIRAIVIPAAEVRSKLSSGIYFIFARTATSDYRWKVAVVRR